MRLIARDSLFACLLLLACSVIRATTQKPKATICNQVAGQQQFYFEPTASCKNCSELELMFDNYTKWLEHQLSKHTSDEQSQVLGSSGADHNANMTRWPSEIGSSSNGNSRYLDVKEVSIFKSSSAPSARGSNQPDSDVVDAALSRLINLEDQETSSPVSGQAELSSDFIGDGSTSSQLFISDSSLDFIREQTKQVTRFVSQFMRYQPVIGDDLFRIMHECKENQNASSCQMWSNLCVLAMYSYSDRDSLSSLSQATDRHHQTTHVPRQELLPSGNLNEPRASGAAPRIGLSRSHDVGIGWQHCKQFRLTSVCNSLRDWHRLERKSAGSESALQSIYATNNEPFSSPFGSTGGALPAPGIMLRPNQPLQLLAYRYSFDGRLIAVDQFGPGEMEKFCLRPNNLWWLRSGQPQRRSGSSMPLAHGQTGYFRLGQNMRLSSCRLSEFEALQLLEGQQLNDTQFIDLYVAYQAAGSMLIKPVPVLIKNLLYNGDLINQKHSKDSSRWRLVHRFFYHSLIATANLNSQQTGSDQDRQQSHRSSSDGSQSEHNHEDDDEQQLSLLYAKSVALELKFSKLDKGALLSYILLTIDYGIVSRSFGEIAHPTTIRHSNKTVQMAKSSLIDDHLDTSLLVEQSLIDMQAYKKDLDLAITILSILSSIWSLIKCYNIQKCYGNVKLDLETLFRFVIIGCDTVALLLLVVLVTFITYIFVSLKFHHSSIQVLAPNEQLELSLLFNLQLAFVFKLIGLIHKLHARLNADIFFIDWEKPRMLTSSQILNLSYQQLHHNQTDTHKIDCGKPVVSNQQQQQVSFWRPYTVINRWFRMQTLRRLNLTLHLIVFVLLLQLTQATQLATSDMSFSFSPSAEDNSRELAPRHSLVFRALIMAYVYLSLVGGQMLYKKYLHEPWIRDPVREFVDLCSVANVSLFGWLYPRFGYYIHGRNANGSGDRGIGEMNALLEREERDLCSKRGLAPNSDHQTFILILPKVINDHYRSLLSKEATSLASKLSSVASNQLLGRQMFNESAPLAANNGQMNVGGQSTAGGSLLQSALNLSASSTSLSVAGSPPFGRAAGGFGQASSGASRIDGMVAKHKSIQQFLTNFLEHVYRDIDYTIREGRRFENMLLLDFDFDDGSLLSGSQVGGRTSSTNMQPANPAAQQILANQQAAQPRHQAATFCKDGRNSFTSLLWFGMELDLVLMELLSFLVLDLWLGQPSPLITASLLWFLQNVFRAIYVSCSRYNLIGKALVDEKFLFSA